MAQVKNSVISLFTGGMGLDLGFERAGFSTSVAVECNKYAIETIKTNRPRLPLIARKIEDTPTGEILSAARLKKGEATLVIGGPSCQPFSTAGQRESVADPRGRAFHEFVRVVRESQPRFFVMENVRGLLSAAIKHRPLGRRGPGFPPLTRDEELGSAFKAVVQELKKTGYYVVFNLLNAADFGVPQARERLVFIGSRDGEAIWTPKRTHSKLAQKDLAPWSTLRDALADLDQPNPSFHPLTEKKRKFLKLVPPGGNWRCLPSEVQEEAIGAAFKSWGGRCGFLRRLSWDKCPPALTTAPDGRATMMCHPEELRPLSTQEYARLQQFPPEWIFSGSIHQQYMQIGNAVPLGLAEAIGNAIRAVMPKRKRMNKLKGIVICTDNELLNRMERRPLTILNPSRMRKFRGKIATARWLEGTQKRPMAVVRRAAVISM